MSFISLSAFLGAGAVISFPVLYEQLKPRLLEILFFLCMVFDDSSRNVATSFTSKSIPNIIATKH